MKTYSFTLKLIGVDIDKFEDISSKLYETGCDDATLSICNENVLLDFDRKSVLPEEDVIESAIEDVKIAKICERCEIYDGDLRQTFDRATEANVKLETMATSFQVSIDTVMKWANGSLDPQKVLVPSIIR
jgi:hypothetical protein